MAKSIEPVDSFTFWIGDKPAAPTRNIWSVAVEDAVQAGYAEWIVPARHFRWLKLDGRIY